MQLLDTSNNNTKIKKTQNATNKTEIKIRMASMSLNPTNTTICPMQDIAECKAPCLNGSGMAKVFKSVKKARISKTDFYLNDKENFIIQLKRELRNFEKLCKKQNVKPYVRLNTISDIQWELKTNGSIPQSFPNINFYDYTKIAKRLGKTPDNYELMFSYSNAPKYQQSVRKALKTDVPMSVVFYGGIPSHFMGKEVVNGDASDIDNLKHKNKIVGLKYKSVGNAVDPSISKFIVNMEIEKVFHAIGGTAYAT